MKIRPLGDRILVKRVKEEEKSKGGIIIPDTAKEKPQEGKVVAVGKGKMTEQGKLLTPDVKAGDKILFGKYSGSEVRIEGEEHLILREDDILGVLEYPRRLRLGSARPLTNFKISRRTKSHASQNSAFCPGGAREDSARR